MPIYPDKNKPPAPDPVISCRVLNPLTINDNIEDVFTNETQAKATTATRLFRNDELFNALLNYVLPYYKKNNNSKFDNKFTIWSSGCSSGEEVYSLAILADYYLKKSGQLLALEAFGTDINKQKISLAKNAVYSKPLPSSFSENYWQILSNYAKITQDKVYISQSIKDLCHFGIFDMRKKPKNHRFDFIVCNHVLQYYNEEGQLYILQNLMSVIKPTGFFYFEGLTEDLTKMANLSEIKDFTNLFIPSNMKGYKNVITI